MAVVRYRTKLQAPRLGVCSSWLAALTPHPAGKVKVPVWVKPGTIRFPEDQTTPVVMVGPGEGVGRWGEFIPVCDMKRMGGEFIPVCDMKRMGGGG